MSNINTYPLAVLDDAEDYRVDNMDEYLLKQMDNPNVDKLPDRNNLHCGWEPCGV